MKKLLLIFCILFVCQYAYAYYDMSTPIEGNSIATNDLQFEIVNDLYKQISKKMSTCTDYSIKNSQIVHFPYDVKKKNGKYVSGYWKELWSIDACGTVMQAPITFYINKKNTIYKIDKNFFVD